MNILKAITRSAMLLALLACPVGAAAEFDLPGRDMLGHAEEQLALAAKDSRHWHSRREFIQRDIHDITFLLQQSLRSAAKSNHAEQQYYAKQALLLLQRGIAAGHFGARQTAPVLSLIHQLLSKQTS